jgi:hypothetical protein
MLLFSLTQPFVTAQQAPRRDGSAWQEMPKDWKTMFLVGMNEGIELGHSFTTWGMEDDVPRGKPNPGLASAIRSFDKHIAYLSHVTVGQIVDGLDKFYEDIQNRRILIRYAVWIVLNMIAGTPKAEVETMLENFKRTSG